MSFIVTPNVNEGLKGRPIGIVTHCLVYLFSWSVLCYKGIPRMGLIKYVEISRYSRYHHTSDVLVCVSEMGVGGRDAGVLFKNYNMMSTLKSSGKPYG